MFPPRPDNVSAARLLSHGRGPISFLTYGLTGGGSTKSMVAVAEGLSALGAEVDFVVLSTEGRSVSTVANHVNLVDLGVSKTYSGILPLISYLRRRRPKALVSAGESVNLVAVTACKLSGSGTRSVVTVRNSPTELPSQRRGLFRRNMHHVSRWAYPKADAVVAVSRGIANELRSSVGLEQDEIDVIYNPVVGPDLGRLATQPLDDPWFDADAPPVIMGVGRLHPQKDFPTLIRAFALVRTKMPCRLMILGEGDERDRLTDLARSLCVSDHVRLPGYVKNPFAYLARARLFVLSSRFEGLPGALIQALACGCPVVSTDCPSGPREILDDGFYGPLVKVGEVENLADAMMAQLDAPAVSSALIERANEFGFDKSVRAYDALLHRVILNDRGPLAYSTIVDDRHVAS